MTMFIDPRGRPRKRKNRLWTPGEDRLVLAAWQEVQAAKRRPANSIYWPLAERIGRSYDAIKMRAVWVSRQYLRRISA